MSYRLLSNGSVQNVGTGEVFPADPATGNRHSVKYAAWLAEGNTPEPADVEDYTAESIERLWRAAHDYEFAQISGSAIGMLAIGTMQGKPKCAAVRDWINTIWDLYYDRKSTIVGSSPIPPELLDFSSCGNIPYTVPELMAEMGY